MNEEYQIIIADDHQIVIDGLKSILKDTAFKVAAEALNGQHAMDIVQSNPMQFQGIITDISMPLLSGTDLCRMVKQSYPHLKVLILSMYSSPPIVREAIACEADGFMIKSAGKEELLTALHKIFNHSTYYSDAILPIIYSEIQKEKKQKENMALLTDRELEILRLIVREYTSEEIAKKLFISKKTVDNHRTHLLEKTGSRSTIGLVKFALKNGLE
ncbi:MAG: response regulator transcription factor [Chitinophagales bacterium]|nr:response regulator transcription factor [Chitinophagales bacterium]MDW8272717.1 response regulator transcription factor [Chitinophagales bacterium]